MVWCLKIISKMTKVVRKPTCRLYVVFLIALVALVTFLYDIYIYSKDEYYVLQPRKNIFHSNCIVIGGMSFIGARLGAADLNCTNIAPIEDSINIEPDVMKWYRWTQLTAELKLPTTLVDFSRDIAKLIRIIESSDRNFIYYVPTGLMGKELQSIDRAKLLQIKLETTANFHKLLNILTAHSSSIKQFTLMSFSDGKDRTWLTPLEQSLLSFHHQYSSINTVIVKGFTKGLYGPWQERESTGEYCWYIDDIINQLPLLNSSTKSDLIIYDYSSKCQESVHQKDNIYTTQLWFNQYKASAKNQTKNVVAGAMLDIKSKYAMRWGRPLFFFPKAENYFEKFVCTASRYSHIDILLIHNHLSPKFVHHYEKVCPKCTLVRYPRINERSSTDQRFYMIYDYLLNHPEIKSLINADGGDVIFTGDPFQVMNIMGDMLYAGIDFPFYTTVGTFPWISKMFKKCFPHYEHTREVLDLYGVFNSGVTGGSRHVMLSFLAKEVLYLDTARKEGICDMTTAQILYHRDYYDRLYAGYPFIGTYFLGTPGPDGSAIKHKFKDRLNLRGARRLANKI